MPLPIADQLHAVGRYVPTRGTEQTLVAAGADVSAISEVFVRRDHDVLVLDVPQHARRRMHPLGDGRYFFKDGAQTRAQVIVRADQRPLLVLEAKGSELRFVQVVETTSTER